MHAAFITLRGQAERKGGGIAKLQQRCIAKPKPANRAAQHADITRARCADFHLHTALEINAFFKPWVEGNGYRKR